MWLEVIEQELKNNEVNKGNRADTETINLYERFLWRRSPSFEKDFIRERRKELKGIRRLCWQA